MTTPHRPRPPAPPATPTAAPPTDRRATLDLRTDLLAAIDAPPGAVTVLRRATPSGDVLVVRTIATAIPADRHRSDFRGVAVIWETVRPPRIGPGG